MTCCERRTESGPAGKQTAATERAAERGRHPDAARQNRSEIYRPEFVVSGPGCS